MDTAESWKQRAERAETYAKGKRALADRLLANMWGRYMDKSIAGETADPRDVWQELDRIRTRLVLTNEVAQPGETETPQRWNIYTPDSPEAYNAEIEKLRADGYQVTAQGESCTELETKEHRITVYRPLDPPEK